jgi:serine/threonine protein kinase
MNYWESKRNLETYSSNDLNVLAERYGIKVANRNDRLWLLSITILSNRHYAQMVKQKEKITDFDTYFTEIKQLGSGTFGFVLLAQVKKAFNNLIKDQYVTVKLIKVSINQKQIEDTQREITILRDLSKDGCNPHIVCYYDSFMVNYREPHDNSDKKYFAIVMEYIPTDNLQQILERHILIPNDKILQYMNSLVQGLEYLHDRNIVHRDVKPSNIIIDKDVVKYVDFGFSCFTVQNNSSVSSLHLWYSCILDAVGSPIYMSPELWNISMGKLNNIPKDELYELYKKSDVWALGIVFYQILYGNLPIELRDALADIYYRKAIRNAVLYDTISLPYETNRDPRLIEIVRKMLIKDAGSRSSIKMVVDELNKL